jgi:hypothetical protein
MHAHPVGGKVLACLAAVGSLGILTVMVAVAQTAPPAEIPHPQPGEVKFANQWVDVSDLFRRHRQAKQDFATLLDQKKTAFEQLANIAKTVAGITSDYIKNSQPVRNEKAQADTQVLQAQRTLAQGQPVQPANAPEPTQPNRGWFRDNGAYDQAVNAWRNRADQVRRDNEARQQQYTRQLQQWKDDQAKARQTLPDAKAKSEACAAQLKDLSDARQAAEKEPLAQRRKLLDEQAARDVQAQALALKIEALRDTILTCPESQRLQRGIVEYRNELYTPEEFQAAYDKVKAEIEASRQAALAQLKPGESLPATWEHSTQDEADAMKAVLDRAKAAYKPKTP